MNFYIGDLHLGHTNALLIDERPWSSLEAMTESIIWRWNNRVGPDDTVYILGDLSCVHSASKEEGLLHYVDRLRGHRILVQGNHDYLYTEALRRRFEHISRVLAISDGETRCFLCHYPIMHYPGQQHGHIHIHAHMHNSPMSKPIPGSVCVSASRPYIDYTPRTLEELLPYVMPFGGDPYGA